MIDERTIESLLLSGDKRKTMSEAEEKFHQEGLAGLARNPTLQKLLDLSMRLCIVDALKLLSDRKFDEAYAALESFSRIENINVELEAAKDANRQEKNEFAKDPIEQFDTIKF